MLVGIAAIKADVMEADRRTPGHGERLALFARIAEQAQFEVRQEVRAMRVHHNRTWEDIGALLGVGPDQAREQFADPDLDW
jgi:hypothetical protein